MQISKIAIKLFCENPSGPDLMELIPVFHRWIRDQAISGLLLDVADYSHVPGGPGVMLVADEGYYALDLAGGRAGLRFARRREGQTHGLLGIRHDCGLLLEAAELLASETGLSETIRFRTDELEVCSLDRLVAPNHSDFVDPFVGLVTEAIGPLLDSPEVAPGNPAGDEPLSVRVTGSCPSLEGLRTRLASL